MLRVCENASTAGFGKDICVPVHKLLILVAVSRTAHITEFDIDLVSNTGFERDSSEFLLASAAKEFFSSSLASPVVDDEVPVDVKLKHQSKLT